MGLDHFHPAFPDISDREHSRIHPLLGTPCDKDPLNNDVASFFLPISSPITFRTLTALKVLKGFTVTLPGTVRTGL